MWFRYKTRKRRGKNYLRVIDLKTKNDLKTLRRLWSSRTKGVIVYAYRISQGERSFYCPRHTPVLKTKLGALLQVPKVLVNNRVDCGAGVNVAAKFWIDQFKPWCPAAVNKWRVVFHIEDIAAMPECGLGKIRVFACRVVETSY